MSLSDRVLKKSNLWHVGAVLLFVIIACAYFSPALKGYTIKQGDIVNFVGMSREVSDYRDNSGEQVLWTNAMFSGMPTDQISRVYEGTWLSKGLIKLMRLGLPAPIFFLFMYFIGFYILSLSLRLKPLVGIIGSIAFGLSSYFIVILEAGHNSKAVAIGLAPMMIAGFIMAYRNKNWILGVAFSSIFMMVELAANHVQVTYYMAFVLLLMGVVELVRHIQKGELVKFGKVTGLLLVGYLLAVMVNYGNLLGTAEYAKQTIRGGSELTILPDGSSNEKIATSGLDRNYVTNWSYGQGESFSLIVPNFKGGETQAIGQNDANEDFIDDAETRFKQNIAQSNQYWGNQPFTSGPVYVGIIVMFLAFLGMVYVKDRYKWALLSATLLAITLSWGKNYVSALVLLPILLYMVNLFLEGKKQIIFTAINTLILLFAISSGEMFVSSSLTDFFLDYIPGYNKLRAVTIILVVAELCIPVLGVLFLQRLISKREEIRENVNGFYIVSGVFVLILGVMVMMPETFNTFLSEQENAQLDSITDPAMQSQYVAFFDALEETRMAIFSADVLRSMGFLVLGIGLIFAFIRTGFSKFILGGGLLLFILLDLILVDQRYLNTEGRGKNYDQWVERYEMKYPFTAGEGEKTILAMEIQENPGLQTKIDSALQVLNAEMKDEDDVSAREKQVRRDYLTFRIMNRNTNFRVFERGNPFNSSYTSYFNKSIGGYHGAKLSRYQDLIDFHLSKQNPSVINMLNTKYYLQPVPGPGGISNSQLVGVNNDAMGNAWFTREVKVVKNSDEEILAMDSYDAANLINKGAGQVFVNGEEVQNVELLGTETVTVLLPGMQQQVPIDNIPYQALSDQALALIIDSTGLNWVYDSAPDSMFTKIFSLSSGGRGGWDPAKTTIIDERFTKNVTETSYSGLGTIEMTSYSPDRLIYESSSSDKQLAVFSEIYYDGNWKAYIDGEETPVSRVNYVLRAVEVPAGEHEIVFEYTDQNFEKAGVFANISSILILLLLGFGLFLEFREKGEKTEEIMD